MKKKIVVGLTLAWLACGAGSAQSATLGDLVSFAGGIATDPSAELVVTGPTANASIRPPVGTIVCHSPKTTKIEVIPGQDGTVTLKLTQKESLDPNKSLPGATLVLGQIGTTGMAKVDWEIKADGLKVLETKKSAEGPIGMVPLLVGEKMATTLGFLGIKTSTKDWVKMSSAHPPGSGGELSLTEVKPGVLALWIPFIGAQGTVEIRNIKVDILPPK